MPSDTNVEQPPAGSAGGRLAAVVAEIEQHANAFGWDRPPSLFALVPTAQLLTAEPDLAAALGLAGSAPDPDDLTPIEQEPLADEPLDEALAKIEWPGVVTGCALVNEVLVLPPSAGQAPEDTEAVKWASDHPERREVRMVVAVLRDGSRASLLRIRPTAVDAEEHLVPGPDLAPNLAAALLATLT